MRILLSNDDGCQAPGLRCLLEHLRARYAVTVVAPDRNRSGASHSLTLLNPVRVQRNGDGVMCVDGTPTDCVHLALTGLVPDKPDMVVSGINAGANLGDDVLYSGTVAAALEGRNLGYPAIAVSSVGVAPQHYETAARVTVNLVERLKTEPLPSDTILNVNVPDVPYDRLTGYQATRLGNRHRAEGVVRATDPRGREIYWVGSAGAEQDAGPGTDFFAVSNGAVSITPILIDLTRYSALDKVGQWVKGL
ncbi:MAG: 5'/3'-nucleotidase SurE [Gammaproteobacteria bacterium]|nr:5'/3'-nucleotidase SurE [Gammaproteobacteria bacterium]